jgi:hypothetical protein
VKDFLPNEEEFETLIQAVAYFKPRAVSQIGDEEVLKATMRIAEKQKAKSDNEKNFEEAFDPNAKDPLGSFLKDLLAETDIESVKKKSKEAENNLILLSAKLIRFRDYCRQVTTDEAIRDLLKP